MQLTIKGKNVEVTDWVWQYIDRKIGKLDRYLPTLTEARVELAEEATSNPEQRQVVQVTLFDRRGMILRGEERSADLFAAVDTVLDTMYRQIARYKGKRRAVRHRNGYYEEEWGETPPVELEEEEEEEETGRPIVRTKRFVMSPMNADEAIEQMELLGHTFFVFYNADDGAVNVIYRRRDGNYGLIVPELG
ncbi:MAG: ribosome-associated translation inhibitor RaiA [Ardenticatenaceae bacterium]|nr:ribosome-associated translation inhibitor RaiA [Ardenticatenaceae bacterium]HBY95165.1 ribosome-associated translation inhibitor RaiA [Chloroflexota bacterium]